VSAPKSPMARPKPVAPIAPPFTPAPEVVPGSDLGHETLPPSTSTDPFA
jgi:hypothetical protein